MCNILKVFVLLSIILHYVWCDCQILLGSNSPTIIRKVGKTVFFDKSRYNNRILYLNPKESVELFCERGFDDYIERTSSEENLAPKIYNLAIECSVYGRNNGRLTFTNSDNNERFNINGAFECSFGNLQIYESNKTLDNCENYASYGLSTGWNAPIGICYDLNTFHIKYVKYVASRPFYDFIYQKPTRNFTVVDLDVEMGNFNFVLENSLMPTETFNQLNVALQSEKPLLKPFVFEYDSLVQDNSVSGHFGKYAPLFKVVWWRELREGNWLRFQDALYERTQNVTYMVYNGVSGSLSIPNTQESEIFQVHYDKKFVRAPALIWSYIKSLEEYSTEEFVIIGHNTPFYKSDEESKLCMDICDQIDWLKNSLFERMHLMPVFGVVNCCRTEEVAHKLDNFPFKQTQSATTNAQISTEQNIIE